MGGAWWKTVDKQITLVRRIALHPRTYQFQSLPTRPRFAVMHLIRIEHIKEIIQGTRTLSLV
jgi:hypothetical protein